MNDEHLDRLIGDVLGEAPPPPRREAIWRGIAARRRARTGFPGRGWAMAAAAAALLVAGVWLGRWSTAPPDAPSQRPPADAAAETVRSGSAYRLAAAGYLGRTEALLVRYRSGAEGTDDLARKALELVGELRLYLDSPAGRDPELRRLLLDLEVVLVRIAHAEGADFERQDIEESLTDRSIMLRIRNRMTAWL